MMALFDFAYDSSPLASIAFLAALAAVAAQGAAEAHREMQTRNWRKYL